MKPRWPKVRGPMRAPDEGALSPRASQPRRWAPPGRGAIIHAMRSGANHEASPARQSSARAPRASTSRAVAEDPGVAAHAAEGEGVLVVHLPLHHAAAPGAALRRGDRRAPPRRADAAVVGAEAEGDDHLARDDRVEGCVGDGGEGLAEEHVAEVAVANGHPGAPSGSRATASRSRRRAVGVRQRARGRHRAEERRPVEQARPVREERVERRVARGGVARRGRGARKRWGCRGARRGGRARAR